MSDEINEGNLALSVDISQHTASSEDNVKSYQFFIKEFNLPESFDLYIVCALIGKYVVGERKPIKGSKYPFIKYATAVKRDEITILNALAIEETDNIEILNDVKAMINIWDEYANSGFEEFVKWYYSNSIDFESKLSNIVSDAYYGNL